jgi:hypothetical protein
MSEGISIGSISLGMNDTRNIDSQVSMPKSDNDGLRSLPTSFYPSSDKASTEYSSPMINEFAGLGDLSISSDISAQGASSGGFNFSMPASSDLGYEDAKEMFAMQGMGGAAPPGFEGHGASFRPEAIAPAENIRQMAELFANM